MLQSNNFQSETNAMTLNNVFDSIRPLHLLSKLFGFSLFAVDRKTFVVTVTSLDVLLIIFNSVLVVLFELQYWTSNFEMQIKSSEIAKNFFPSMAYINYLIFTFAKVWNFTQRHKFGKFLKLLNEVDGVFDELGFSVDHKSQTRFTVALIVLIHVAQVAFILLTCITQVYLNMSSSMDVFVFSSYGYFACLLVVSQFIISVNVVKERLRILKEAARWV